MISDMGLTCQTSNIKASVTGARVRASLPWSSTGVCTLACLLCAGLFVVVSVHVSTMHTAGQHAVFVLQVGGQARIRATYLFCHDAKLLRASPVNGAVAEKYNRHAMPDPEDDMVSGSQSSTQYRHELNLICLRFVKDGNKSHY